MTPASQLDLTVVVAAIDADRNLPVCVEALERSCQGLAAEILIVGDVGRATVDAGRQVDVVSRPADQLAPELWAAGIARARGRVVALTTAHMTVDAGWARALIAAIEPAVGGAGGPLTVAPNTGVIDWAIFYLRYSAFLVSHWRDGETSGEIAGDNAAYAADDLRRHAATFAHGFWEVDFHRLLRADRRTLRRVAAARAAFGRSFRMGTFVRQRFEHGRTFGRTDVESRRRGRARLLLSAPVVPLVLAGRAAIRVGAGPDVFRFVVSLPLFLLFAGAWAAGEAAGALTAGAREGARP